MIVGGSKANVQSRYMCVCVCTLLSGSEFCRCIVSTIRRKRRREKKERKKHERNEEQEDDGESSSDDHIFVVDDTVYGCLLKLDIFHSRHVLGEARANKIEEKEDDTQKTGANETTARERELRKKVRDYGRSLLSQREEEREKRNEGLFLLILLQHEHHV